MKTIDTLLIDDERSAIENLSILLEDYCPEVNVVAIGNSVSEGIKLIKKHKPTLVFLDISMPPEGTGFDVLNAFPNRSFHVVFVTAYEEFSLKAIKSHAFDYILKPLDYLEVVQSIEQFKQLYGQINMRADKHTDRDTIALSTNDGIHVLKKADIFYIKAEGSYVEIFIKNRRSLVISRSLKSLESSLDSDSFMRVHRSYLVNVSRIDRFIRSDGGYLEVEDTLIPVSENFREKVISLFS